VLRAPTERELDHALQCTFPASDPISFHAEKGDQPPRVRQSVSPHVEPHQIRRGAAGALGGYYVLTGIWPIVSPGTFQLVLGPKVDMWLAQVLGAVLCVPGTILLRASYKNRMTHDAYWMAIGVMVVLIASDVILVSCGIVRTIYLADAAVQFIILIIFTVIGVMQMEGRVRFKEVS
jgi:hypothetical protein